MRGGVRGTIDNRMTFTHARVPGINAEHMRAPHNGINSSRACVCCQSRAAVTANPVRVANNISHDKRRALDGRHNFRHLMGHTHTGRTHLYARARNENYKNVTYKLI